MKELQYLRPQALDEALELLDKYGKDIKILAGGTDLIIALQENFISCKYLMDIKEIKELKDISFSEEIGLNIGASVCLNDIISSDIVKNQYSILVDSAKTLANSLLRNRATLVGNLCNASPGGDMLSPSIVLEGIAVVTSKGGTRKIPLKEFFIGVKKTQLKESEIVTKIIFPNIDGKGLYSRKSRIKGHDLAQVGVACFLKTNGGLNLAIGAAGPTPIIVEGFENIKKDDIKNKRQEIINKVINEIKPIGDQRASKEYRIAMVEYLTGKVLDEIAKGG